MIRYYTAIKDDVIGDFTFYGEFPSLAAAKRAFTMACQKSDNLPVSDIALYVMCSVDVNSGDINTSDPELGQFPYFVMRGEKNEV